MVRIFLSKSYVSKICHDLEMLTLNMTTKPREYIVFSIYDDSHNGFRIVDILIEI